MEVVYIKNYLVIGSLALATIIAMASAVNLNNIDKKEALMTISENAPVIEVEENIEVQKYKNIDSAFSFIKENKIKVQNDVNIFDLETVEIGNHESDIMVQTIKEEPVYEPEKVTVRGLTYTYDKNLEYVNMENLAERLAKYSPNDSLESLLTVASKMIHGEAVGCSKIEKAAVLWCVLDRFDENYADSIQGVITAPGQFHGYNANNPVNDEIYELCKDVIARWVAEKEGNENVGRVLPTGYNWFYGDGVYNYFRNEYKTSRNWDWSLPSPYNT